MATEWTQTAGMDSETETDNVTPPASPASDTSWAQKSGMTSATDVDNLESYAEQADASATAAAASATAAAASAAEAAASVGSISTEVADAEAAAAAAATSATSASTSATTATTKAAEASTSATNAATSATAAQTAQTAAETAKTAAEAAQTGAETAETNAASSATAAASSATAAQSSADAAVAALDDFDDRYLGQKASDPTVDNDGDPLVAGTLYFNTTDDVMKVYEGSTWVAAYASLSGALIATNNLSDLNNAATARTNLGLGTAATTASTDYATAAQGALADSALQSSDIGVSVQGYSAVLAGTTASYTTAEETKLAGIEAGADVTDAANVAAAGAAMTANNLSDLGNAATARTNLGLGTAATTASTDYATAAQGTNADTAFGWGNHALAGYLTSYIETDPIYVASTWYSTTNNSSNWDTAYGWGNHASAGYLTGITGQSIKNLSDVYSSMAPTDGQALIYDTTNGWQAETIATGGGATGGGTDEIFWENDQTVTSDYTITNGKNAGSFGPITINTGVTVTVGAGEVWTVV